MRGPPPSTLLVGNLLYSLRPRSSIATQAHRAPLGLGPAGDDQGQGDMVDRRPATVVILLGRATLFACRGAGVRAYLSMPFYAAFQAPCVASGGTRGRALWALKQKTGPVGLRFPPLRGGASVFQLAPRYPPSASWGLRRRLRRGWKGGAGHRFPPAMMDPVLVGPGFFVGRATARHFNAPAHQRGSDFSQENNEIDQI